MTLRPAGVELPSKRPIKPLAENQSAAKSAAVFDDFTEDSQLRAILAAWPTLTEQARNTILAIAENPASKDGP